MGVIPDCLKIVFGQFTHISDWLPNAKRFHTRTFDFPAELASVFVPELIVKSVANAQMCPITGFL